MDDIFSIFSSRPAPAPQQVLPVYDLLEDDDEVEELDPDLVSIAAKVGTTGSSQLSSSSQDLTSSQSSTGRLSQQLQSHTSFSTSSLENTTSSTLYSKGNSTPPSSQSSLSIPRNNSFNGEGGSPSILSPTMASLSTTAAAEDNREIRILLRMIRHPKLENLSPEWEAYHTHLEVQLKVTVKAVKMEKALSPLYYVLCQTLSYTAH